MVKLRFSSNSCFRYVRNHRKVIFKDYKSKTIECIGPEKYVLMKLYKNSKVFRYKRILIPTPLFVAKIFASFFEICNEISSFNKDQLILLNYDNTISGKYKTNVDLKLNDGLKFLMRKYQNIHICGKQGVNFQRKNI